MRDLTQHLTTRADDSHATPVFRLPCRHSSTSARFRRCQALVRFCALVELNHTLRCLCGPPSIPLSFSLAAVLPRRDTYCVCADTAGVNSRHIQCPSFTAWTTGVSNPVRSPRLRALASGLVQSAAFATGVPPDLYAFHHYTRNSTDLSQPPVVPSRRTLPR